MASTSSKSECCGQKVNRARNALPGTGTELYFIMKSTIAVTGFFQRFKVQNSE